MRDRFPCSLSSWPRSMLGAGDGGGLAQLNENLDFFPYPLPPVNPTPLLLGRRRPGYERRRQPMEVSAVWFLWVLVGVRSRDSQCCHIIIVLPLPPLSLNPARVSK